VAWERVTRRDVLRAIHEYDRLGPEQFFAEHGFAPTTTYELVSNKRRYPPKAAACSPATKPCKKALIPG
jgi:hypothetical protein